MRIKYIEVRAMPILIYGYSTGLAPIHVSNTTFLIKTQNIIFLVGLNFLLNFLFIKHKTNNTRIDPPIADTPPNLEGIARKIAYANKKYHSGWICVGVDVLLAGEKFSTSPNIFGFIHTTVIIKIITNINGVESFTKK